MVCFLFLTPKYLGPPLKKQPPKMAKRINRMGPVDMLGGDDMRRVRRAFIEPTDDGSIVRWYDGIIVGYDAA